MPSAFPYPTWYTGTRAAPHMHSGTELYRLYLCRRDRGEAHHTTGGGVVDALVEEGGPCALVLGHIPMGHLEIRRRASTLIEKGRTGTAPLYKVGRK